MRNNKMLGSLLLCISVAGVASCGKQDSSTASVQPAPATTVADGQQQADLKIVAYGPKGTDSGKSFNTQSSGDSALWVKLNHPNGGSDAAIWWGDHRLNSAVNGTVISAVVPSSFYADAGRYPLQVRAKGDSLGGKSNIVYFVVK